MGNVNLIADFLIVYIFFKEATSGQESRITINCPNIDIHRRTASMRLADTAGYHTDMTSILCGRAVVPQKVDKQNKNQLRRKRGIGDQKFKYRADVV